MSPTSPPYDRGRLRDRDTADQVQRWQTALWAGAAGAVMGMMLGVLLVVKWGWPPAILVAAVVMVTVAVYALTRLVTLGAARAAGTLHNPSGQSTPYHNDYSQATALVIQGDYLGAVALYREAITASPKDPEPRLRMARVLRDHLSDYEEAGRSLRAARTIVPPGSRIDLQLTRELVELALDKMHDPPRAAAELARLIAHFPGTPEARWAREELADIKRHIEPT